MKFILAKTGDIRLVYAFKGQEKVVYANELYTYLKEKGIFKGDLGESKVNIMLNGEHVIFLGLGEEDKLSIDSLRKAFFDLGKELTKYKIETISLDIPKFKALSYDKTIGAVVEGLLQSDYKFDKFKTDKKPKDSLKEVYLNVIEDMGANALNVIEETETIMEGIYLTRDLVNEPAINMYPEILAQAAKDELEELGIKVEIFGRKEIEKFNMKSFLAVSEGSSKEPRFIVLSYEGAPDSDKKIALVGKGLTFDSGGYSLKSNEQMKTMFSDMAGSATVIGAMKSIAKSKLKKNVVGIIAACENLVSGKSYKPGDIIGSMSGKTIEIVNADAEGRLTLADALWYATTVVKADKIVDLATLTYSCVAAFGNIHTGAVTNNDNFMKELIEASKLAGEPVWELPNDDEYKELYTSDFADFINDDKGSAGAVVAGLFLGEFVKETPWVHLDIAGTAYIENEKSYLPKGATGIHVKTLYNLVKEIKY